MPCEPTSPSSRSCAPRSRRSVRPPPDGAPQIAAGDYLAAVDAFGESPLGAPPTAALRDLPAASQVRADLLLAKLAVAVSAEPADVGSSVGCQAAATAFEREIVPGSTLFVRAGDAPVTVELRRFAPSFMPPLAPIPAATTGRLVLTADDSPVPWRVRLTARGPFSICE